MKDLPSAEINPRCYEDIVRVGKFIKEKANLKELPKIGIICGSGLGELASLITNPVTLSYSEIPGFLPTSVPGHKGNLVFGGIGGKRVVCLQGRFHPYEHNMDLALCSLPVRIMHQLGVKLLIVSNAAGGTNENFQRGDFMIIKDHLFMPGLAGLSPLVGLKGDQWGPKFVSMHNVYDAQLRKIAMSLAKSLNIRMHEGIYSMSGGPQYESAAEIAFYKGCGVDALGMSTCHEVVVARQCDIKVFGLSLITNLAHSKANPTHEEVLESARKATEQACKFVERFITELKDEC